MKRALTFRLIVILSIPVFFFSMFQLFTITLMVRRQNVELESHHKDIHESIASMTETIFSTIEKNTTTFSQSIWVQEYFQEALSTGEREIKLENIKEATQVSSRFNTELVDVMLVQSGTIESVIGYGPKKIEDTVKNLELQWNSTLDSRNIFHFITTDEYNKSYTYIIHMMPVFSAKSNTRHEPIGFVSVISTAKNLSHILNSIDNLYCEISSTENNVVYLRSAEIPNAYEESRNFTSNQLKDRNLILITYYDPETPPITDAQRSLIISIAFSLIYVLFCSFIINIIILRPIRLINAEINKAANDYPKNRILYSSNDAIGSIAVHINRMLEKINVLNESVLTSRVKLYEAQLKKSQTLLYAFHSQVAPHFLFNTLQCIRSKALISDMIEIADMCGNVSQTLRYVLSSEEIVTIKEELGVIERYLNIISIRFPGKITYEVQIDKAANLNYRIPKMILQPLAENAVYHGLEPLNGQGHLIIRVDLKDTLRICLIDNGVGFESTRLQALNELLASENMDLTFSKDGSENIGLVNVHNRIRLRFGMQYGITIDQKSDRTMVFITLPLHEPENLKTKVIPIA